MIHYTKLTRGLMPACLYAYNDKTDVTISVYQGGSNLDVFDGSVDTDMHEQCSPTEFMQHLFTALEKEHKNLNHHV